MTTGQRIAAKRKEYKLSQEALGEQLGVSRQSIYKTNSQERVIYLKRITALLLSLLMAFSLTACGDDELTDAVIDTAAGVLIDALEDASASTPGDKSFHAPEAKDDYTSTVLPEDGDAAYTPPVEEGKYYYDLENVVLYLDYYGQLPENYITKSEARSLGWEGGTPECFLEGAAIGGDTFGNREGVLPDGDYTECDLNTDGESSRGAERLVFSDDGRYYHTEDHYESFTQVWVEDGEVIYE